MSKIGLGLRRTHAEWRLDAGGRLFYSHGMARPSKTAETATPDALPFEDALSRLEGIVEAMETGELPLEALLAKYEEGMKLAAVCQAKLADAEVKIQQLEKTAAGEFKLKPLNREPGVEP